MQDHSVTINSKNMFQVSVIVPAKNAGASIDACLNALRNQDYPAEKYEIIVVNDGSTDNTVTLATPYARVITQSPKGPAAARNLGAAYANGDILLFTDADCQPERQWISKMIKRFEDPAVAGVKGVYTTDQSSTVAQFVQIEYEGKYNYMLQFPEIDFIDTYSAGFRKKVFLQMNGFDESFPGASVEDQEFSFRIHEAGYKMRFAPEASVKHLHAATICRYAIKKFRIGYWKVKVLKRHPRKSLHDTHTPPWLKIQIPLAFLSLVFVFTIFVTGWIPAILFLAMFIGSAANELADCIKKGTWRLRLMAPLLLYLRALSLGSGLIFGFIQSKASKRIESIT
ncbi:glycosyltransferase [bacterium]|nr:glycosyltransferase [candidate division CSSED10-310 bacterium]